MAAIDNAILLKETIRINARKELEIKYHSESAILSVLLPDIRECILDGVTATFRKYIEVICDGAKYQSGDFFKTRDGQLFRFSLAPNIRCPEELCVTFYPANTLRSKIDDVRKRLGTDYGGYTHIVITRSSDVQLDINLIQTIAECVISTTYEWTYSRLFAIAREVNETITNRLYGRLREIYPELQALDRLWMGFVHKGRCHYLIESRRRESLLLMMSQAGRQIGVEPLALTSLIIGMDLPFEKSAAHEAFLVAKKPLRVNIGKLPYSASSPDLVTAEQIIFGSDEIIVIPISHIERTETFLVAFSPSADSEFWIGALERNKKDINAILRDEISSLSKIAKASKRYISFSDAEKSRFIGDTIGHIIATFFERIRGY